MGNRWEIDGKSMGNPWEIDGKSMGNRWEIDGKSMGNPWEIDGKSMGNRWEIDGYQDFADKISGKLPTNWKITIFPEFMKLPMGHCRQLPLITGGYMINRRLNPDGHSLDVLNLED